MAFSTSQSYHIYFQTRFQVVVHLADVEGASEENLKSILESPIRDTKLPLGADVTVSRVTVADFNECNTEDYNDCSDQVMSDTRVQFHQRSTQSFYVRRTLKRKKD